MTPTADANRVFPWAASLVAAGGGVIFVGCIFYMTLGTAGLPLDVREYAEALARTLQCGPRAMGRAGGITMVGDFLLTAGAVGLVPRHGASRRDLDGAAWGLVAVGGMMAIVFDSLLGSALYPLAASGQREVYLAVWAWFDSLFALSMMPMGLAGIVLFGRDVRSESPLLHRPLGWAGAVISAVGLLSGLGYTAGLIVLPRTLGLAITVESLLIAVLGVQVARRDW